MNKMDKQFVRLLLAVANGVLAGYVLAFLR